MGNQNPDLVALQKTDERIYVRIAVPDTVEDHYGKELYQRAEGSYLMPFRLSSDLSFGFTAEGPNFRIRLTDGINNDLGGEEAPQKLPRPAVNTRLRFSRSFLGLLGRALFQNQRFYVSPVKFEQDSILEF